MRDAPDGNETWRISHRGLPRELDALDLGSSFLVGNGARGYRGTLEEDRCDRRTALIPAGLYDQAGDKWREPVNLPNPLFLQLTAGTTVLDAHGSLVEQHEESLDLRRAVHGRRTTFRLPSGTLLTLEARRFVSAQRLPVLALRCTLTADRDCSIGARARIDTALWDLNGPHLGDFRARAAGDCSVVAARTREKGVPVAVAQAVRAGAADVRAATEGTGTVAAMTLHLGAGAPLSIDVIAAALTGVDCDDPAEEARRAVLDAAAAGFDALLAEHCVRWAERWAACSISIHGDPRAERALRFSMYHLLAIAPQHSPRLSIPARGLSGQMYKGAIFWDTEVFMLPFFTLCFPRAARSLLLYRFHTLDGARRKAREYGYRGAFYAWESQETGDDACTLFNITDVITRRPLRTYFRDKQVHISADVACAVDAYVTSTGDVALLRDGGAEVIFECARFLLSLLYYSRERSRSEILDVTGPDEYHERVHNDTWTNWISVCALDACIRAADRMAAAFPTEAGALRARLAFDDDLAAIREARVSLYRPGPRSQDGVIPQFDGYLELEDAPLADVVGRRLHPHEYLGGGSGVAVTTQIIKQADVVLALALVGQGVPSAVKKANWDYYEPRTEHGSSLSACAYSLVAAQVGRAAAAYDYFMKAAETDLGEPGKSFVGTLYIGGTHPAAAGGAWMAVVQGMCGITVEGGTITVQPHLPAHWEEVVVPLVVQGQTVRLCISARRVRVESGPTAGLRLRVEDAESEVPASGVLEVALP